MKRQLYMGGGIMDIVPREQALLGGIKRAVKKVTKGVKSIAKSDLGKAALAGAALYGLGGAKFLGGEGIFKAGQGLQRFRNFANLPSAISGLFTGVQNVDAPDLDIVSGKFSTSPIGKFLTSKTGGNALKLATLAGVTGFLTSTLGMTEEQAEEELARDPSGYLEQYYRNLNPPTADTNSEEYEAEVRDFVTRNTSEYAVGGRVGFSEGTYKDFEEFMMKRSESMSERQKEELREQFEKYMRSKDPTVEAAEGGRIGFANGPVLPPDTTQPVNPFGPKPGDFGIEEDIPIKMAGYGYNEAMSDTFDMYNDMKKNGLIPPTMTFDEFLQEVVPEMSKMKTEGRGLAAIGGRMNFDKGTPEGLGSLIDEEMVVIITQDEDGNPKLIQVPKSQVEKESGMRMPTRGMKAKGDTASMNAMQAAGIEGLPIRQNPKGVKELDLRKTGGFIQPVGIKEKADDIPAMLSNNEFVFTADAVRGMGGGDVNRGAQRLYDQMKMLEVGGKA